MSFDAYVRDALDNPKLPHVNVGTQFKFLSLKNATLPLHHLFAYEQMPVLMSFLEERFGRKIELPKANTSPAIKTEITPETEARFRAARADDYALYARVLKAGGHLELEYS
ncbi:hypothetical protein [Lentibacter sp.]|uniref:hypothetical protein n=1 Tax=Lentibacter sp. TaxID=2024994 RepID=UPI003F69A24C